MERRQHATSAQESGGQEEQRSPIEISPESVDRIKVILLGAPAVGKTSIIQASIRGLIKKLVINNDSFLSSLKKFVPKQYYLVTILKLDQPVRFSKNLKETTISNRFCFVPWTFSMGILYIGWSLLSCTSLVFPVLEYIQSWLNYKNGACFHAISDYKKKLEVSCTVSEIS